ncbi:Carnitine acetyl transferase [Mycena indigotica]|uniref:Carnitine O-acetyltransferase, mitochondrial n=1 Tax=Mycena indigotica TaxID=2126181 RepID=A0A8H6SH71_9AGAR|nr:Carnitine acetyl transferase [Mycena indigotica]KAF7298898.1 Carnitine acetyl transferase [Mycena indigotica]
MLRLSARLPRRSFIMPSARKNSTTPEVAPKGYAIDPSAGPMLRFQASLPKLPIPALESTAQKYLDSAKPHLTPVEFSQTEAAVHAFLGSPLAAELQKRLEARAAEPGRGNWLSDWWNDVAYMGYRDPVVVFVSYFYVHVNDRLRTKQAQRAAALIKAMLPFRQMVESKELEPEKVKGAPLCMSSYKWLFHSCRYPVKPSDTAHKFDPATHNHIVFVRKNKFFQVPLAHPSGKELSAAELESQIERVIELAGSELAPPVGALTSDNRDNWTDARAALLAASPVNAASLEAIESAMIIVALDDTSPVTREEISKACWVGDGRNRFYDKHQLIVFENGRSGFLGEHSCMDGTPTLRMNEFVLATLATGKADLGTPTGETLPTPTLLPFELTSSTLSLIDGATQRFDDLVGEHELHVLQYTGYGKTLVAKTFKASPDAWAQLVKQLAFGRMFGRPGVTYESAQTRKFQLGRTEVIRAASNESKAWVDAMLDVNETDENRVSLMREAIRRHGEYATWAADGQGVDRHLFGLKRMLRPDEPVPEIYQDAAFSRTNHWELSTSQLSSPFFDGWGYGEVVPDGYGLSYAIGERYIRWTITSKRGDAARLRYYLEEAATEAREVMERVIAKEQKEAAAKGKL